MTDTAYFTKLDGALRKAGCFRPTLVIDRDRLDHNIDAVRTAIPESLGLRLVDKSLASIPLLRHIMEKTGSTRIMSFHLPVTLAVLEAFPDVEVLYGKPLPTAALARAFGSHDAQTVRRLATRTVFLVDSLARLGALSALADKTGFTLRIAFEVDTGMHRGGFATVEALREAAFQTQQSTGLRVEGIMGYEAHIPEIPALFGGAAAEAAKVKARMSAFAKALPPEARRIINTGGSKTALTYADPGVANEVSMGSGFLKPIDFDSPSLDALQPACFIATPALKVLDPNLPGPLALTRLLQLLGLFPKKGCFLYGGKWMAEPVFPPDMKENRIWGLSSNQQLMALAADSPLKPDDFVFFRPTQSEAVLQYFGPIAVFSGAEIVETWEPIPCG